MKGFSVIPDEKKAKAVEFQFADAKLVLLTRIDEQNINLAVDGTIVRIACPSPSHIGMRLIEHPGVDQ